jgi:DegV family protein with EDD domain
MARSQIPIAYIDSKRLFKALTAGMGSLFRQREHLNTINVFPVPDGDTGTNLTFTFKAILEAIVHTRYQRVDELAVEVANAALDGARGNSGAIMAQYFHAFAGAISGHRIITARDFAKAAEAGAKAAWNAMDKPVPGTLPTVMEDHASALIEATDKDINDIGELWRFSLKRAQISLANTPNQLPVLRQAGVVDAGAQGFVDLLEGIASYIENGELEEPLLELPEAANPNLESFEVGEHRYCTECVISGQDLDHATIKQQLAQLDATSLVVAGGGNRIRVHIHVNNPAEVFLACERFGSIQQQKADDMERQHGLMNQSGSVAIVTDSGADIPAAEVERLGIHIVPVRLSFGDREYLDGVSITPEEFYRKLAEEEHKPLTSQPPVQDFTRVYALLTSHGYEVVSVGLSTRLSGTTAAAIQASGQYEKGKVRVIDTLNAATGQGLIVMLAAEAAESGLSGEEIEAMVREVAPKTRVFAVANNLQYAIKGGRFPAWVKKVTDFLRINPVLTASPEGKLTLGGFHRGKGANSLALAKTAIRKMDKNRLYRVLIAHANNAEGATQMRRHILEKHSQIHSCHVTEAGPAVGVHLGPGGLIVGFVPQMDVLA